MAFCAYVDSFTLNKKITNNTMSHQFIIIGTGFAAIIAAIELKRKGWHDFVMLERRDFAGGTWQQNRYPGAAVDVHSPLYSLSGKPYPWTQMFAKQSELAQYTQELLDEHDLSSHIQLKTSVKNAQWDEQNQFWQVEIDNGEFIQGQFLLNCTGALSTPVIPEFEGLTALKVPYFHTNQWPDNIDLRGKRVAIIGSGASATQVIPAIQPEVEHLHVFQRTPHWVIPRSDIKFPKWFQSCLRIAPVYNAIRWSLYWYNEIRFLGFKHIPFLLKLLGEWPAKRLLRKHIQDPELRDKLTPDFTIGCKRIILSNTLYPALASENVTLHDKHDGVRVFYESGIETELGERLEFDAVVFATGFNAADGLVSYDIVGRNDVRLTQVWHDYAHAYLGTMVPQFPNLFIFNGPNTGIGHTSALFILESQIQYVSQAIESVLSQQKSSIEVTTEAETLYNQMLDKAMQQTVWSWGGCKSWYQNAHGKVVALLPTFTFIFRGWCKAFKPEHHHYH